MFSFLRYIKRVSPKFLSPFWFVLGSIYRYVITKLKINFYVNQFISTYGPFKVHCFFAFSNLKEWGLEQKSIFPLMMNKCKNKKCIVDIGSHIGLTTLPLSSVIKENAKIFSFEPSDVNRNFLKLHVLKNKIKNVEIVSDLVGEKKKKVTFFESNEPTGMNSIINVKNKKLFNKKIKNQTSLDIFFKKNNYKPDLIKIDAEGSEIFILKGSIQTILKYKPEIFLSIHKQHFKILGLNNNDLFKILKKINYNIKDSSGNYSKDLENKEYYLYPR